VRAELRSRFDYEEARIQTFQGKYACPSVVLRDGATNHGATDTFQPWADAVAEG
jgi:gamma-glutamyltranspeptidase/glutathione hydrolase